MKDNNKIAKQSPHSENRQLPQNHQQPELNFTDILRILFDRKMILIGTPFCYLVDWLFCITNLPHRFMKHLPSLKRKNLPMSAHRMNFSGLCNYKRWMKLKQKWKS